MTRRNDSATLKQLTELLIQDGPDAMAQAFTTALNHALVIEREVVLAFSFLATVTGELLRTHGAGLPVKTVYGYTIRGLAMAAPPLAG